MIELTEAEMDDFLGVPQNRSTTRGRTTIKEKNIARHGSLPQKREKQIDKEDIQRIDLKCAICYNFIAEPAITPCQHVYCLNCIENCVYVKTKCPLCRQSLKDYTPELNQALQNFTKNMFKVDFEQRKEELIQDNLWTTDKFIINFDFGNKWRFLKDAIVRPISYDLVNHWTLFLKTPKNPELVNKVVSSVKVTLCKTFKDRYRALEKGSWALIGRAYAEFEADIKIKFQKWTGVPEKEFKYQLIFDDEGNMIKFNIAIDKDIWKSHKDNKSIRTIAKSHRKFKKPQQDIKFKSWRI